VSEAEWQAEIVALRANLGPLHPMRVTWRWKRPANWARLSLWTILADTAHDEDELWVALFEHDAEVGDESVVELRVQPQGPISTLPQGGDVPVAGRVEPGGAIALVTPEGVSWPLSPATVPLHRQRLNGPSTAPVTPRRPPQPTGRVRVRLAAALLGVFWIFRVGSAAVTGQLRWSTLFVATAAYAATAAILVLIISAVLRIRRAPKSDTA
jgi:hypothetical protein